MSLAWNGEWYGNASYGGLECCERTSILSCNCYQTVDRWCFESAIIDILEVINCSCILTEGEYQGHNAARSSEEMPGSLLTGGISSGLSSGVVCTVDIDGGLKRRPP